MEMSPLQMNFLAISLICYVMTYLYISELIQYQPPKVWMRIRNFLLGVMIWFFFIGGIRLLNQVDSQLRNLARRTNPDELINCLARLGSAFCQLIVDIVFPTCSNFLPERIPKNGGVEMCSWLLATIFFASLALVEYRDGFRNMIQSICLSILYVSADNKVASLFVVVSVCCIQQVGYFIVKEVEIRTGRSTQSSIRKDCLRIVEESEEELAAGRS